jgi:hypothetical protein
MKDEKEAFGLMEIKPKNIRQCSCPLSLRSNARSTVSYLILRHQEGLCQGRLVQFRFALALQPEARSGS